MHPMTHAMIDHRSTPSFSRALAMSRWIAARNQLDLRLILQPFGWTPLMGTFALTITLVSHALAFDRFTEARTNNVRAVISVYALKTAMLQMARGYGRWTGNHGGANAGPVGWCSYFSWRDPAQSVTKATESMRAIAGLNVVYRTETNILAFSPAGFTHELCSVL